MKEAMIYSRVTAKGVNSFYLEYNGKRYYLFGQPYRKSVHMYFKRGVRLSETRKYSKLKGNLALERTMGKLLPHIKYIEKDYNIIVLNKTLKKSRNSNGYRKCA